MSVPPCLGSFAQGHGIGHSNFKNIVDVVFKYLGNDGFFDRF